MKLLLNFCAYAHCLSCLTPYGSCVTGGHINWLGDGAFRLVRSRASRLMQQLPHCTIAEHRPHITVTGHPHERCEMLNNIGTQRHFIPAAVQNEGSWRPLCLAAPVPCQRGITRHGEVHLFATDDDLRTGHTEDSQGLAIPEGVAFMPAMSPQQDNERSALRSMEGEAPRLSETACD